MPRFSIIVPAFKVQAFLRECLESVLAQECADFELIAVDDCSPDASGRIIDEFARRDRRVTAVHLDRNVGLGPARNAGMAHARGDYLLFLDSDDTLVPGALQAIADRIEETGDPDVLVYDYARTYWSGRVERNQFAELLRPSDPQVFRLEDRPSLLRLLMVVWNKAYRREFVHKQGFEFPPGYYEDTPWTYPALMAADSIAVLDQVCVHYRQRRQGNILGTTSRKHFDIFDQYDRVFAFIDSRPELASWRPLIFRRMVDHFTTIFNSHGRLPRSSRAEFFRRARSHYRRYRSRGASGRTRTRLRHGLVRLGGRRTFRTLWTLQRVRGRARRHARAGLRALRAAVLQVHYRIQLRLPVRKNQAVFAAYWHRGYACNPAAIERTVRELLPQMRTAWVAKAEHEHTVPEGVRRLRPGTAAYWTALARAKYLVNNVNFDRRLAKRPGQVLVQTHHGTPLKHMGLDLQERPAAARGTDFARLLRSVDRWDYCLSANQHSTLTWERVYPSGYTTLEYGYPRNDRLLTAGAEEVLRVRRELGIAPGTTTILYAPTHRDYRRSQQPAMDPRRLARALGPGFTVLVRAHYSLDGAQGAFTESAGRTEGVLDVSAHPSVEDLCLASDALVTDYSSLMFDYANLDRPIVVFTDDWEAYNAARGTYFDITAHPPGLVARTADELVDIFATPAWHGPRSAELRATFRSLFCPYDDGRAAERVVRHVFLGETEAATALPVVPMEDRRPAPSPQRALACALPTGTSTASTTAAANAAAPPVATSATPDA